MAKIYIICRIILCHDMTICYDMRFISEILIYHCMKRVISTFMSHHTTYNITTHDIVAALLYDNTLKTPSWMNTVSVYMCNRTSVEGETLHLPTCLWVSTARSPDSPDVTKMWLIVHLVTCVVNTGLVQFYTVWA